MSPSTPRWSARSAKRYWTRRLPPWSVGEPTTAAATAAKMAVNMSARQAQQADMPALVRAALERHCLQPSDLVLELTESVLIEAGSSTLRQLTQLRSSGVSIAINDFGTGHSTLSQLAILPVDAIKIDRSFTKGLPEDTINAKIVRAVAGLAEDLGLVCIFAGIDSREQLAGFPHGVLVQGAALGRETTAPLDDQPRRRGVRPAA